MSYKERRDKLAEAHYEKRAKLFDVNDFTREVIAVESYKVGFDAGRADTLKLADEILVNKIKELLCSWGDEDGKPLKNLGSYSQLLNTLIDWKKAKEE